MSSQSMRQRAEALARQTQDTICAAVEKLDGARFREDSWQRPGGGGGDSRVLQDGGVFEKAGVNVSVVYGAVSAPMLAALELATIADEHGELAFFATGISTVLHPQNPHAPTAHANYRYFEIVRHDEPTQIVRWWFGGGADLTPSYLVEDDARHFHRLHQQACEHTDASYYPRFKRWCDEYFRLHHRAEARGIGGIFFDRLDERPAEALLTHCRHCAEAFVPAYLPLCEAHAADPFGERERRWQQLRRGRYVEFNLLHDRGTLFGLHSGGRIESILMSLPLTARWEYDVVPEPHSPEAALVEVLREPRDWV
jgi:coproporphyrinogen III oxidase